VIPNQWYPVLQSKTVGDRPFGARRFGKQLVFWRDGGRRLHCMVDRCPHKGVRLSRGKVVGDRIQCPYHGFQYNDRGQCELAPCLGRDTRPPASLRTEVLPAREHDGFAWVWWGEARETLPPLPLFPELEAMDLTWHTEEWTFEGHYTRYLESLTEAHHIPFVHATMSLPIPEALTKTRLFRFIEYGSGQNYAKESLVEGLKVWTEGTIIRSTFNLRPDDGKSFDESPGHAYEISVGMPCMISAKLPIPGLHAFVTLAPVDEENTWIGFRYLVERKKYPPGVAKLIALGTTIAERHVAQPQDWPILSDQTPNVATPASRRFVASDRLNAVYLKMRDQMIKDATGSRITRIDEPRTAG